MKIKDGGPAFPNSGEGEWADPETCKVWVPYKGMTKREWFAGQALPAVIQQLKIHKDGQHEFHIVAYEIADAMIAAGEKGNQ